MTNAETIGAYAFINATQITEINLPDNLIKIKNNAFENCSDLLEITIPEHVEIMEQEAFKNCTKLQKVTFETEKIARIEDRTFYNCPSLSTINSVAGTQQFPASVTKICDQALFNAKALTNFTVGENVTAMGSGVFGGCILLEELTLPFIGATRTAAPVA